MGQNIVLVVDYHDEKSVVRRYHEATQEEDVVTVPTSAQAFSQLVEEAQGRLGPGGRIVWIMESTTGWPRVQELLGDRVDFHLVNVVQMPLPPKAKRRKTDKVDTQRMLREYQAGTLPWAHMTTRPWRELRRLAALRENLVSRRTALRNGLTRYLAHETWEARQGLWSKKGQQWLRGLQMSCTDRLIVDVKLDELAALAQSRARVEQALYEAHRHWPEAQRLDAIKGIGPISAVSMLARIGPIARFARAEELIAYAGLAPGLRESDATRRFGRVGGTDKRLRHYVIEATIWVRRLPRYRATYERVEKRRGKKIARLVVGRMLLRSIHKMLRDRVEFREAS
jgi:transposase